MIIWKPSWKNMVIFWVEYHLNDVPGFSGVFFVGFLIPCFIAVLLLCYSRLLCFSTVCFCFSAFPASFLFCFLTSMLLHCSLSVFLLLFVCFSSPDKPQDAQEKKTKPTKITPNQRPKDYSNSNQTLKNTEL